MSAAASPASAAVVADSHTDPRGDTHKEEGYASSPRWKRPLSDIRKLTLRRDTATRRVTAVATMQKMRSTKDPGQEGVLYLLKGYNKDFDLVWQSSALFDNGKLTVPGSTCSYFRAAIRPSAKQMKMTMNASCVTKASTDAVLLDTASLGVDPNTHEGTTVTTDSLIHRYRIY